MASARDLRRRIKSIKSTQQITKAMKMVAAAKLRRAQERVIAARPFAGKIQEVMARLIAANSGVSHPLLEVREPKTTCYVVVSGDRGLCGGYNANILRLNYNMLYQKPGSLVTIGRKGRDFFRRRGYDIKSEFIGIGEDITFGIAKEIGQTLVDYYVKGIFDEVYLVFTEFKSAMTQKPSSMKLLPVEPPSEGAGGQVDYIYEPDPETMLGELLPKYINTTIYRALLESKASEEGARMTAMGSATDNASEMIDKLTLSLNRARQAAITKEISEIVGGANALD